MDKGHPWNSLSGTEGHVAMLDIFHKSILDGDPKLFRKSWTENDTGDVRKIIRA